MANVEASVKIEIDSDLCKNNQYCEAVCPLGVLAIENNSVVIKQPLECTVCFKCVESCPSGAINLLY